MKLKNISDKGLFILEQSWRTHFPIEKSGATKYGENGIFVKVSFNNRNIPNSLKSVLAKSANHAVTRDTWGGYKTSYNMLLECEAKIRADLSLPLNENKTLIYVAWLIDKGLKGATIKSYLSGLRSIHISKGFGAVELLTPLVKQVIVVKVQS